MDHRLQPPEELAHALGEVMEQWLVRCVVETAERHLGECPPQLADEAGRMAAASAPRVMIEVRALLDTDVDQQRGTPLTVLRSSVSYPTEVLRAAGVPPAPRDEFDERAFPSDVYRLGPAHWSDVDESLQEPGIAWGAWKAAVVLRRRREEGLR